MNWMRNHYEGTEFDMTKGVLSGPLEIQIASREVLVSHRSKVSLRVAFLSHERRMVCWLRLRAQQKPRSRLLGLRQTLRILLSLCHSLPLPLEVLKHIQRVGWKSSHETPPGGPSILSPIG